MTRHIGLDTVTERRHRTGQTSLKLVSGATEEPLTTAEAKTHLRMSTDITAEDDLIDGLIVSAREWGENFTNRAFTGPQTWRKTLDRLPPKQIEMNRSPVSSTAGSSDITITLEESTGGSATVSSTKYYLDSDKEPPRVVLKDEAEGWGDDVTLRDRAAVKVEWPAGYGKSSQVPETIKAAMKLYVGDKFENREDVSEANLRRAPRACEDLLWAYRVPESG